MPRISAPTVAEHRSAQRAALVRAAVEILLADGVAAAVPRAVCERAGLSRTSFYDYFPSRDDLLIAVAIDAFDAWDREIEAALAAAPADGRLRTYVEQTLAMVADGKHQLANALREAQFAPSHLEDLMTLHDALVRPLVQVLAEQGVPAPERHAQYVNGLIGAAIAGVEHGLDPAVAAREVTAILAGGLGSPAAEG
ncbi:TetR/AcrR family transcriptional regulator [Propioniciclava coleopterorum]|uniref:TetR/AcrR family transcriptional regulator n=1 Tax=Propioniciclava coleopterorum TaxID=2714937 RepID=A0A6G7Y3X2_9ACTN|nr:TetR/AcrR family transcriptional regulator [Propioniciclava coleopterorum]QIK71520.1 TetR/AcrR family transcriptional regulator [Propioniciclava coleopterorum]